MSCSSNSRVGASQVPIIYWRWVGCTVGTRKVAEQDARFSVACYWSLQFKRLFLEQSRLPAPPVLGRFSGNVGRGYVILGFQMLSRAGVEGGA